MGKAYSVAGQAAACLHTMSLLQVYQAELLADLNEGEVIGRSAPGSPGESSPGPGSNTSHCPAVAG